MTIHKISHQMVLSDGKTPHDFMASSSNPALRAATTGPAFDPLEIPTFTISRSIKGLHNEVADSEKERRELPEKVADIEREGRELQKELDRCDEADADIGAASAELWNPFGDRVAITFWRMRLRLTLEGLAQQLGAPRPWVNR